MSIVLGTGDLMVRKTDNVTVDEINKGVQHLADRSLPPCQIWGSSSLPSQEHVLALRAPLVLSETETFRSGIGWRLSEHFG